MESLARGLITYIGLSLTLDTSKPLINRNTTHRLQLRSPLKPPFSLFETSNMLPRNSNNNI